MTEPLPTDPMVRLLAALELSSDGENTFSGPSLHRPGGRVFGGQVLAQALLAAGRTVPDGRLPHSLHGYFLRPGDVEHPITFAVERLRDGRSFSARRTHAIQGGEPILSMITSFQHEQEGIEHQDPMPAAPRPEDLDSTHDVLGPIDHPLARFWVAQSAFDLRHVDASLYLGPAEDPTDRQMIWMRARGVVPDDQLLHRALLAYACDEVVLEPVLRKHGLSFVSPGLSVASLDHAMWWHRPVRVDEWLLYVQSSPSAQGGRGLSTAKVYSESGALVASIAQEGMFRVP
ncbi:acyl-CoA thioesterase [Pengzhenrongella sicca]|uniref:Acyl-CoA thioesterase 2 n=1 Tax=Pengzhenrongella sicca TaxID=2819238 RepID=A0A8A4ZEN1_9MICO|nr:acyl-CoA thioesterase II [Pengzhenrongella sicca]QTE30442.1 acyl-CoA thioesterase II [Pengzhenrongella sicca]